MNKMKRTRASTQFWLWFERNSERFLHLTHLRTKKEFVYWFDELQMHAMAYSKLLGVDLYLPKPGKGQLTITTHGKAAGFHKAEQLVKFAPELKNWKILALRQPSPLDTITGWVGLKGGIALADTWFQPAKEVIPGIYPIRAYVDYILPGKEWNVREQVMLLIELLLGEKVAAINLDLLEVDSRCNASKRQKLRPLAELPEYIASQGNGLKIDADGQLKHIINGP